MLKLFKDSPNRPVFLYVSVVVVVTFLVLQVFRTASPRRFKVKMGKARDQLPQGISYLMAVSEPHGEAPIAGKLLPIGHNLTRAAAATSGTSKLMYVFETLVCRA